MALCNCCEKNDATHLVESEITGEQVPYCDECDGSDEDESETNNKHDQ